MTDLELGRSKLQQALLEISKNYLENLELAHEEDISFSPKLECRMARLLKAKRKSHRNLINTSFKKTIAACLAIIIFAGAIIGCNKIREPIVEFFTGVYEKFTEFFFGMEDKETASKVIEEVHMPTYVPEGYELVENGLLSGEKQHYFIWKNNENAKIVLYQSQLASKTTLDTEISTTKIIDDGTTIAIIQKNSQMCAFWNDDIYAYTLTSNSLSEDEIIKIVKSLK